MDWYKMPSKQFQAWLLFCLEQVQKGLKKSVFSQKILVLRSHFAEKFNHRSVCGAVHIYTDTHMYMHTHICIVFQLNWDKRNQGVYIFHLSKRKKSVTKMLYFWQHLC